MLARLPLEIIDLIFECLDFEDIRSIARVCAALRLPAQLRLFRAMRILISAEDTYPKHTEHILSSPHLLQYASRLTILERFGPYTTRNEIIIHPLWFYLSTMYRLSYIEIALKPSNTSRVLSALESLDSAREIGLKLTIALTPDLLISDNPLPVRSLSMLVHTLGDRVGTRLLQKCSASLRELHLYLQESTIPSLPFLPHLFELSLHTEYDGDDPALMSWFPFFYRHPTITRLSLDRKFTLGAPVPPNLLPNLRSLEAHPILIELLIPGRPVHNVHAKYYSDITTCITPQFPVDILLQPLQQSLVPVTTLEISTRIHFPKNDLINIVQALPKLCKITLGQPHYEVCPVVCFNNGRRGELSRKSVPFRA